MKRHFATIKDIARELQISVSTVSRALRDTYDVSQETREKVLAMAAQLHYKPNFNAIGLVNNKTNNIGIILPAIANYYFATVITGIQQIAYSKGYNIILYVTNDCPQTELAVIENLVNTSLDGLLVCISSHSDSCDHFQEVIDCGTPVVFFDRVASNINTSKVVQDDYNGAFEAVEHLVRNGYRRIAHLAGPQGMLFTQNRLQGYLDALAHYKLPVREEWIIHGGFTQECGEAGLHQLLECEQQPDAIFVVNDRKAIGVMLALKQLGIRIGKEMAVVGFTNDPVSGIISPSMTTVAEPALEIGRQSCELLLKHINKKNFTPKEVVLPTKLIVRESTLKRVPRRKPEALQVA
jgi:LacI family transcriptional regulator